MVFSREHIPDSIYMIAYTSQDPMGKQGTRVFQDPRKKYEYWVRDNIVVQWTDDHLCT